MFFIHPSIPRFIPTFYPLFRGKALDSNILIDFSHHNSSLVAVCNHSGFNKIEIITRRYLWCKLLDNVK